MMSNTQFLYVPFITYGQLVSDFDLCDYKPHTVEMSITSTGVAVNVDGGTTNLNLYPVTGYTGPSIRNTPVYIGGLPGTSKCLIIIIQVKNNRNYK